MKKEIKKVKVDADVFKKIMEEKEVSFNKLGKEPKVLGSSTTIRRSLKEGEMKEDLAESIAAYLGVDICDFEERLPFDTIKAEALKLPKVCKASLIVALVEDMLYLK